MEGLVLEPVRDVKGDDWHRAPDSNWSLSQIVSHLAIGVDLVATAFEDRLENRPMERRATPKQGLLRHLVLGVGKLPEGFEAPTVAAPPDRPDPDEVVAQFRMGVERLGTLTTQLSEERQTELFVKHPIFGDFNLPEWVRFHYLHCRHHKKQIKRRLEWLEKNPSA